MVIAYEQRLDSNLRWALEEGSMHFEQTSAVHKALRKVIARLEALGIEYAVVGGMALFAHGVRRFTEDVDLLVDRDGLKRVHDELEGRGYLPPFSGSRHLRDAELGVRIEFLVAGEYPGDGKPKPVSFPDPGGASVVIDQMRVLTLEKLVELKLASGMTTIHRAQDVADVVKLIRSLRLSAAFAERLHPFVREKFRELQLDVETQPDPHEQSG
jgi:hypothetical protein